MIDDDWLWYIHFEKDAYERSDQENGAFEKELRQKEKYYEKKYNDRDLSDP